MITISDAMLILATFAGPIAAVQAQKWIERARDARNRRLLIFQTLMATRAMRASSPDHVQALNLIDVHFNRANREDKTIRNVWMEYLDFFNQPPPTDEALALAHNERGVDLLVNLLELLGKSLGYDFNKVHLKRGGYYPRGPATENATRLAVLDGLDKVLSGKKAFPMAVVSFPVSADAMAKQNKVQDALLETLSGDKPLKIASYSPGAVLDGSVKTGHQVS